MLVSRQNQNLNKQTHTTIHKLHFAQLVLFPCSNLQDFCLKLVCCKYADSINFMMVENISNCTLNCLLRTFGAF